jgi:phosphoglycerate dehydrogenase-like enzyme
MTPRRLSIWCNYGFPAPVLEDLQSKLDQAGHRLLLSGDLQASNLAAGARDPLLAEAEIALGQPDPRQLIDLPNVRWAHLTTAGYTRFDTPAVRQAFHARGSALTTSSWVYEEPCAEHVLAFLLAHARQIPATLVEQRTHRAWRQPEHRARSALLTGQTALIYGYGTIARRVVELLKPLRMNLVGVRRSIKGDETVPILPTADADSALPKADHVINILPASEETDGYFDSARFALMKPGAVFHNIGRGTTVSQPALIEALNSGRLEAAYLDVTDPEPLPPEHPLWSARNCWITPHTAGGHAEEFLRLAEHFLNNLARYERGETLIDRVI